MYSSTRCAFHISRTPIHRTQWRRICLRQYATDASASPAWFEALRKEMLARKLRPLFSTLAYDREESLEAALRPYLPPTNSNRRTGSVLPLGHHLIFFNPLVPADQLLPDGTDAIHSPGAPFMRRMWAGGKLSVNPTSYFAGSTAWLMNRPFVCSERIKDVQLRGQDAAEKVFVTIDRRFDSMDSFGYPSGVSSVMDNVSWESATALGDASLVEERNLVFMKDRTSAELSAFQSGAYQPVRYLKAPLHPDFSHTLTPTPALLSHYSALTINHHGIHLNPEYARTVEGHRNLLVHGPLALTLMLRLLTNHLNALPGPAQCICSIEYRNLAPLYCDEQMRLCGRLRTGTQAENGGGDVYDVWIEGPTGGMAVKGTVRVEPIPGLPVETLPEEHSESSTQSAHRGVVSSAGRTTVCATATKRPTPATPRPGSRAHYSSRAKPSRSGNPQQDDRTSQSSVPNPPATHFINENLGRQPKLYIPSRSEKRRMRAQQFYIPIIRRVRGPPGPMKQGLSFLQRNLVTRLLPQNRPQPIPAPQKVRDRNPILQVKAPAEKVKNRSLVRYYKTTVPHDAWKQVVAVEHSRFARRGVKKVEVVKLRKMVSRSRKTRSRSNQGWW